MLTEREARALLAKLSAHYGEPVRPAHEHELVRTRVGLIELGDLRVDATRREVWLRGRRIEGLHETAFRILALLAREAGRVLSRQEIIARALGAEYHADDRMIDWHVRALRAALGEPARAGGIIETVRGVGYRLRGGDSTRQVA